ncbi:hypothetical protein F4861DRAFT_443590 [Xylaria intraflava]|nr:hypothetical protein F4861DRAFT_443590 [Xylaria intraflava]
MGVVGSLIIIMGMSPFHPLADCSVPIDGWRGWIICLVLICHRPSSCTYPLGSPSTWSILYLQLVIDSPVGILVERFLFLLRPQSVSLFCDSAFGTLGASSLNFLPFLYDH